MSSVKPIYILLFCNNDIAILVFAIYENSMFMCIYRCLICNLCKN